jgi:hypothetical protein
VSTATATGRIDWATLPELLDRPALRRVLGLKRRDIDRIFDACDEYRVPGSSKPYVHRDDVRECLQVRPPAPRRAA